MIEDNGGLSAKLREIRAATGLSLAELSALSHFSKSHLSNIEAGRRTVTLEVLMAYERVGLDRRNFLTRSAAVSLDVISSVIRDGAVLPRSSHGIELADLAALSDAMGSYAGFAPAPGIAKPLSLVELDGFTAEVHRRYQAADYVAATRMLPKLINSVDALTADSGHEDFQAAIASRGRVYTVAAKLLTKVGDPHYAWLAADRAAEAALRADNPMLTAASAYQVSCALLRAGRASDAERVAVYASDAVADKSPLGLSLRGALTLISAVIAGRRSDRGTATERLALARTLANQMGTDANHGWTAFGPTNVQIHAVSIAVELGDPGQAASRAAGLKTDNLPFGLQSRRAQLHIDNAWALVQKHQNAEATMNLLQAEQVAPQALRYSEVVHGLLQELLRHERGDALGLRALAARAGVAA